MIQYNKSNLSCWTPDRAYDWYASLPWLCGFNYVPAYAGNSTEMWQEEDFDLDAIRRELTWAADWGYNSLRVFLQYIVWRQDPEGIKTRFSEFLAVADSLGFSVVPVLFDDCGAYKEHYLKRWILDGVGYDVSDLSEEEKLSQWRQPYLGKQPEPLPAVHNSIWTPSPGSSIIADIDEYPHLKGYVLDFISAFGEDHRVLFWDLYNEPGNGSRFDASVPLVQDAFAWAREACPRHPLTACIGFVYHACDAAAADLSDIVTFHSYSPLEKMTGLMKSLDNLKYPLILTEWMARTYGSSIPDLLPWLKERSIGCYQWGLVSGKTQTRFPWGYRDSKSEPDPWFHDVMRQDGTPYERDEYTLVKDLTNSG